MKNFGETIGLEGPLPFVFREEADRT